MPKHKNSVIFLKDWTPLIEALPPDQQSIFWGLFMRYEAGMEQKCTDQIVLPTWTFIKSQLDKFDGNYQAKIVERNRENGKKGGRPKDKPKTTQVNPENPVGKTITQITLKENVNENKNDNENIFWNKPTFYIEDYLLNIGMVEHIKTTYKLSDEKFMELFNDFKGSYIGVPFTKMEFEDKCSHFKNKIAKMVKEYPIEETPQQMKARKQEEMKKF